MKPMNSNDTERFSRLINMARANYDKEPLGNNLKLMWLQQLAGYSIEQVEQSIMNHLRTSQFAPRLSDLIAGLQGTKPRAREILAAARLKNSPLGVMAASHIGSWDLNSLDDYALETRAQEVVDLYCGWEAEYARGETDPHIVAVMARAGVLLGSPFRAGSVPPSAEAGGKMIAIANAALNKDYADENALRIERQKLDEITPEQRQDNRRRLLDLVSDLGKPEPPKTIYAECPKCGHRQNELLKTCEQCGDKRDD